jgi:hypothetical protein
MTRARKKRNVFFRANTKEKFVMFSFYLGCFSQVGSTGGPCRLQARLLWSREHLCSKLLHSRLFADPEKQ